MQGQAAGFLDEARGNALFQNRQLRVFSDLYNRQVQLKRQGFHDVALGRHASAGQQRTQPFLLVAHLQAQRALQAIGIELASFNEYFSKTHAGLYDFP